MPLKPDPEIENALMDFLMDGEASLAEAAEELGRSPTVLARVASRLQQKGLICSRVGRSMYGRSEVRWSMVMTRKAA